MTIEEVKELKEGDVIYWASGKEHLKGTFVKFVGNVLDLKVMLVKTDDGVEDEILHVFLTNQDIYEREMKKTMFKTVKVKTGITKKEKIDDESEEASTESVDSSDNNINEEDSEESDNQKITTVPKVIAENIKRDNLQKVSGHRNYGDGPAPTLKTLQVLLAKDGISIERDKKKWIRYHIVLENGTLNTIDFSGKVFELYNTYLDKGIQGILELNK